MGVAPGFLNNSLKIWRIILRVRNHYFKFSIFTYVMTFFLGPLSIWPPPPPLLGSVIFWSSYGSWEVFQLDENLKVHRRKVPLCAQSYGMNCDRTVSFSKMAFGVWPPSLILAGTGSSRLLCRSATLPTISHIFKLLSLCPLSMWPMWICAFSCASHLIMHIWPFICYLSHMSSKIADEAIFSVTFDCHSLQYSLLICFDWTKVSVRYIKQSIRQLKSIKVY